MTGWQREDGIPCEELPERPLCPMCGRAARIFYHDQRGDTVGCDCCLTEVEWEDEAE